MTRRYLDHASTSPLRPESAAAMAAALTGADLEAAMDALPGILADLRALR
jgi:hypothetical protein